MYFITDKRFDLAGGGVSRVGKHFLISKLAPYEDFGGGPGWKHLLIVFSLHYFGGFLAWIIIHFEKQIKKFVNV